MAISGVVAASALGVFSALLRTIRTTEAVGALNVASGSIDDHLRLLVRNLGGGALHPGQLVYIQNSANVIEGRATDRLTLARAVGDGVLADDTSSGGEDIELKFEAVEAEAGAPQCPLTTVPRTLDGLAPVYENAVTFFGVGTPVLLVSDGRASIYRGASALEIERDSSDEDFQDCEFRVELDPEFGSDPITIRGDVAIFPLRLESLQLVGQTLPAPLLVTTRSATHARVDTATVVQRESLEFWPTAFDFQVQAGFDVGKDGVVGDSEWTFADRTACTSWPSCVQGITDDVQDMRQLRYGVVLGAPARPSGMPSTAQLAGSDVVNSTKFHLRALQGRATLRNTVQRR
jgi:hypothetical protein